MAIKYPTALRNSRLDLVSTRAGAAALLKIYAGSRPADANTAISGQTLLATLTCGTPFAPAAAAGVLTANAIPQVNAVASGTATFFRLFASDGATVVADGDVNTSGADCNLNTTNIVSGGPVVVNSLTVTAGNA